MAAANLTNAAAGAPQAQQPQAQQPLSQPPPTGATTSPPSMPRPGLPTTTSRLDTTQENRLARMRYNSQDPEYVFFGGLGRDATDHWIDIKNDAFKALNVGEDRSLTPGEAYRLLESVPGATEVRNAGARVTAKGMSIPFVGYDGDVYRAIFDWEELGWSTPEQFTFVEVVKDHGQPDTYLTLRVIKPKIAANQAGCQVVQAGGVVAYSCIPIVGEMMDAHDVAHPDSTGTERAVAGVSLATGPFLLGFTPNAGAFRRAGKLIKAAKTVESGEEAAEALARLIAQAPKGTKPLNSPDPVKWVNEKGGTVWNELDGTWVYKDIDGNVVRYPGGYPDFEGAGFVRQQVDIDMTTVRPIDDGLANAAAPLG
ncbi:MAG: hypothetical protein KDA59_23735, partial [Planctomycetales bacterium]|nr:hypothetical protein [Planctomycetales bacterium]